MADHEFGADEVLEFVDDSVAGLSSWWLVVVVLVATTVVTAGTLLVVEESLAVILVLLIDVDIVELEVDKGNPLDPRKWAGINLLFNDGWILSSAVR